MQPHFTTFLTSSCLSEMLNVVDTQTCPHCHTISPATNYFCPNCGKKLKDKPVSTSVWHQIGIYLLSIFLPPLGLWPGIRYLKQKDSKAKIIGAVAIVLTIVTSIVTILISLELANSINKTINEQLNPYTNIKSNF